MALEGHRGVLNINPVAPALANALQDATGVRYRELPLTPERIYSRLGEQPTLIPRSLIGSHGHENVHRHRGHGHHRPDGSAPVRSSSSRSGRRT